MGLVLARLPPGILLVTQAVMLRMPLEVLLWPELRGSGWGWDSFAKDGPQVVGGE